MMRLAELDLTDDCLLALVTRLRRADFGDQADRIVESLMSQQSEVTLTLPDRVAILTVLDDPPPGLNELRAVLQEHASQGTHRSVGSTPKTRYSPARD